MQSRIGDRVFRSCCENPARSSATCSTPVMIVGPPEPPATSTGLSCFITMIGVMLESGRLPGAIEFASAPTSL